MDHKLRKIQLCQLEILEEVARICDKHGIDYWLAYGTMLGAVRHKGFIPWDDDLDIFMTMEGFLRFQKICKKELSSEYFLQTPETEPTMGWLFFKVRKNGTVMLEPHQTKTNPNFHYGVWIDIFPLISISNSNNNCKVQYSLLRELQKLRGCHPTVQKSPLLKNILKLIYSRALRIYEFLLWRIVIVLGGHNSNRLMIVNSQFYPHVKRDAYENKIFDRCIFSSFKEYDFENHHFRGVVDYDAYLSKCYSSDYMIPKRYNSHIEDYSKVEV